MKWLRSITQNSLLSEKPRQQVKFGSAAMNACLMGFFKWSERSRYRAMQSKQMLIVPFQG